MTLPSLAEVLPHKPPMVLLDEIIAFDDDSATCAVTIRSTSTFAGPDGVPSWVALEYCAQCIAVFAGLRARARGGVPRMGLLVAARDMTLETDRFALGDRLIVRARLEFGEERVGRFICEVTRAEAASETPDSRPAGLVAKASVSVYLPEHVGAESLGS